mmetsp:Transcript_37556/g.55300  ORF Transcript_37556/g.55300 Transcript_37556/m.55300 type:complete len:231 (+) Transcript_37556:46-738(+)|eukprot:CAMPEP_0195517934 /NCGR_PEP_ID=MMETSP0794_2-20130614/11829_1 /TAXON_ID=515487 /ORGANISM="Stephanopyxis turris, Strain CCMP 815" /LENGTH=230 /DNA_ID=CAMNT_0040646815 /DNA_START=35 /DNA_END=727 /DNA_ORIENTATION=+
MDLEQCLPSTSEKYSKRKSTTSMMGKKKMCFGALFLAICLVVVWYLVLAPASMLAAHKKIVNEKLEQLTVSIQMSKEMVTTEFEGLTKSLGSGHEELISKLEAENKLLQNMVETLKTGTDSKHEEDIAKFKADRNAEVAKLNLEVSAKQQEITNLKDDITTNKDALEKVQAIIDKTKVDVSLFCAECIFDANGMKKTTCGKRKEYLMNKHGTREDVAIEAVMTWDLDCKQ